MPSTRSTVYAATCASLALVGLHSSPPVSVPPRQSKEQPIAVPGHYTDIITSSSLVASLKHLCPCKSGRAVVGGLAAAFILEHKKLIVAS